MSSSRPLFAYWLGRRAYAPVHQFMQELFQARKEQQITDTLLLLEHEPVITLGKGAKREHLLGSPEQMRAAGIELAETGRGGDVTLHAPGQLVAYPIFDLAPDRQDVRKYVQGLTRVMQALIAPASVSAGTIDGKIGLWVDARTPELWPGEEAAQTPVKIGAIGVRISRWVTQHGFALNLTTDLQLFNWIIPCGIQQWGVTSLEQLTQKQLSVRRAAELAVPLFAREYAHSSTQWHDWAERPLDQLQVPQVQATQTPR